MSSEYALACIDERGVWNSVEDVIGLVGLPMLEDGDARGCAVVILTPPSNCSLREPSVEDIVVVERSAGVGRGGDVRL
jgi:hypothetical protein